MKFLLLLVILGWWVQKVQAEERCAAYGDCAVCVKADNCLYVIPKYELTGKCIHKSTYGLIIAKFYSKNSLGCQRLRKWEQNKQESVRPKAVKGSASQGDLDMGMKKKEGIPTTTTTTTTTTRVPVYNRKPNPPQLPRPSLPRMNVEVKPEYPTILRASTSRIEPRKEVPVTTTTTRVPVYIQYPQPPLLESTTRLKGQVIQPYPTIPRVPTRGQHPEKATTTTSTTTTTTTAPVRTSSAFLLHQVKSSIPTRASVVPKAEKEDEYSTTTTTAASTTRDQLKGGPSPGFDDNMKLPAAAAVSSGNDSSSTAIRIIGGTENEMTTRKKKEPKLSKKDSLEQLKDHFGVKDAMQLECDNEGFHENEFEMMERSMCRTYELIERHLLRGESMDEFVGIWQRENPMLNNPTKCVQLLWKRRNCSNKQ